MVMIQVWIIALEVFLLPISASLLVPKMFFKFTKYVGVE